MWASPFVLRAVPLLWRHVCNLQVSGSAEGIPLLGVEQIPLLGAGREENKITGTPSDTIGQALLQVLLLASAALPPAP